MQVIYDHLLEIEYCDLRPVLIQHFTYLEDINVMYWKSSGAKE